MLREKIEEQIIEILGRHEEANLASDISKSIIAEDVATIVIRAIQDYLVDFD